MAWETRHVKISALNDSQYIGVSVYSVVITSCIVVVLANLISERVTLAYLTITVLILSSTTATLCLLFLPKINDILTRRGDTTDPVIHSMGLKMECNTRRFVTDDPRELQYRVEVQNRVYKKEMAALDAEILKLERLLEGRSSTSSSSISLPPPLRPEVTIINEFGTPDKNTSQKIRNPSISGVSGLPLLLLSVLPPVIPRASWPSADHMQIPMRRSVTFSSQPHLDDCEGVALRLPAIDLLNLRLTHQQATAENRTGILNKIRALLIGSRSPSRKPSTASVSGGGSSSNGRTSGGIAAALSVHMGVLSGLVTSTGASSFHGLNTIPLNNLRKKSIAKSGSNLDTLEPNRYRKYSTAFTISGNSMPPTLNNQYIEIESEPRVNFQLPAQRRPSICHQNSQPTLRERVKGSPRFPHRIVPTSSLNALQDDENMKDLDTVAGDLND